MSHTTPDTAHILRAISLFSSLSEQALQTIAAHSHLKAYRKNTIVIEQGDDTNSLYLIVSGKVKVYVSDEDGNELVLHLLGPGEPFGELALLGDIRRTATVMTQEDSKLLTISRLDLIECLHANPEIALDIIRHLVERLRITTERMGALGLNDVYGRVAAVLAEQAREEDGRLITDRLTQQDLAQMVGASRVMISRIFKDLRQGGYIDIENKRIILKKKLPSRW